MAEEGEKQGLSSITILTAINANCRLCTTTNNKSFAFMWLNVSVSIKLLFPQLMTNVNDGFHGPLTFS